MTAATRTPTPKLTSRDVRRVCGDIPEWKVENILATDASLEDLEEAASWASGDNESTPMRHLPPHSPAAAILEILTADEEDDDFGPAPGAA
jgi:hypothetical protein